MNSALTRGDVHLDDSVAVEQHVKVDVGEERQLLAVALPRHLAGQLLHLADEAPDGQPVDEHLGQVRRGGGGGWGGGGGGRGGEGAGVGSGGACTLWQCAGWLAHFRPLFQTADSQQDQRLGQ